MTRDLLLKVDQLKVVSATGAELVRDVSIEIPKGKIVGLVGESGCGKSITALTISGLLPKGITPQNGEIWLDGQCITHLSGKARQKLNGNQIGMVFQDALAALNVVVPIGKQIEEVLKIHTNLSASARKQCVLEVMKDVGLPDVEDLYNRYPHALSGGQRQRVLIAMSIINRPKLVIADEPTTALDAQTQIQILDLLKTINQRDGVSILLISHDLKTVWRICDEVTVLYAGMVAEVGSVEAVCHHPKHVYTKLLLGCVPTPDKKGQPLVAIKGRVTDSRGPASACLFAPRCPLKQPRCESGVVPLMPVGNEHLAACYYPDKALPDQVLVTWSDLALPEEC